MKKILILLLIPLLTSSIYGQKKFTVGLGGMISRAQTKDGIVNNYPFSHFVNFGVKLPFQKVEFGLEGEWNITNWDIDYIDPNGFFFDLYAQTDYLKISPNMELKVFKFFGITLGSYVGIRMSEIIKQNLNFGFGFAGTITPESISPITKYGDFGWSYGAKIHFSKKFSFTYKSIRGLRNIARKEIDINGTIFRNSILRNRNIQLGIEFNLAQF